MQQKMPVGSNTPGAASSAADFWFHFGSQIEVQKNYFFGCFSKMAPREAQEAPRGFQEASKSRFRELLGFILEGFWHHFWDCLDFFY